MNRFKGFLSSPRAASAQPPALVPDTPVPGDDAAAATASTLPTDVATASDSTEAKVVEEKEEVLSTDVVASEGVAQPKAAPVVAVITADQPADVTVRTLTPSRSGRNINPKNLTPKAMFGKVTGLFGRGSSPAPPAAVPLQPESPSTVASPGATEATPSIMDTPRSIDSAIADLDEAVEKQKEMRSASLTFTVKFTVLQARGLAMADGKARMGVRRKKGVTVDPLVRATICGVSVSSAPVKNGGAKPSWGPAGETLVLVIPAGAIRGEGDYLVQRLLIEVLDADFLMGSAELSIKELLDIVELGTVVDLSFMGKPGGSLAFGLEVVLDGANKSSADVPAASIGTGGDSFSGSETGSEASSRPPSPRQIIDDVATKLPPTSEDPDPVESGQTPIARRASDVSSQANIPPGSSSKQESAPITDTAVTTAPPLDLRALSAGEDPPKSGRTGSGSRRGSSARTARSPASVTDGKDPTPRRLSLVGGDASVAPQSGRKSARKGIVDVIGGEDPPSSRTKSNASTARSTEGAGVAASVNEPVNSSVEAQATIDLNLPTGERDGGSARGGSAREGGSTARNAGSEVEVAAAGVVDAPASEEVQAEARRLAEEKGRALAEEEMKAQIAAARLQRAREIAAKRRSEAAAYGPMGRRIYTVGDGKESVAAVTIQSHWRGKVSRKTLKRQQRSARSVQAAFRGLLDRRKSEKLRAQAKRAELEETARRRRKARIAASERELELLRTTPASAILALDRLRRVFAARCVQCWWRRCVFDRKMRSGVVDTSTAELGVSLSRTRPLRRVRIPPEAHTGVILPTDGEYEAPRYTAPAAPNVQRRASALRHMEQQPKVKVPAVRVSGGGVAPSQLDLESLQKKVFLSTSRRSKRALVGRATNEELSVPPPPIACSAGATSARHVYEELLSRRTQADALARERVVVEAERKAAAMRRKQRLNRTRQLEEQLTSLSIPAPAHTVGGSADTANSRKPFAPKIHVEVEGAVCDWKAWLPEDPVSLQSAKAAHNRMAIAAAGRQRWWCTALPEDSGNAPVDVRGIRSPWPYRQWCGGENGNAENVPEEGSGIGTFDSEEASLWWYAYARKGASEENEAGDMTAATLYRRVQAGPSARLAEARAQVERAREQTAANAAVLVEQVWKRRKEVAYAEGIGRDGSTRHHKAATVLQARVRGRAARKQANVLRAEMRVYGALQVLVNELRQPLLKEAGFEPIRNIASILAEHAGGGVSQTARAISSASAATSRSVTAGLRAANYRKDPAEEQNSARIAKSNAFQSALRAIDSNVSVGSSSASQIVQQGLPVIGIPAQEGVSGNAPSSPLTPGGLPKLTESGSHIGIAPTAEVAPPAVLDDKQKVVDSTPSQDRGNIDENKSSKKDGGAKTPEESAVKVQAWYRGGKVRSWFKSL